MNKKYIKFLLTPFVLGLIILIGCTKDFEEINTDPEAFTTASDGSLFNHAISSLKVSGNEQFYIANEIIYKQTQLGAIFKEAWGNASIGSEAIWTSYYKTLPNFRELEKRFSTYPASPELNNMKAMVSILLAYKTFRVTDYFGDIPFSDAGYGFMDVEKLRPTYDSQKDIYIKLLNDLEWAVNNIDENASEEPLITFKSFDNLFKGDMKMWIKFANSLRLRYAIRMYDKEPEKAGSIIADIIQNDLPVLTGCSFTASVLEVAALNPYEIGYKNSQKYWAFREHRNLRMGTNIWHQMSHNDSTDGSGIFDVRAYYFFETNNNNEWIGYPQFADASTPSEGGVVYDTQRNTDGGFIVKGTDNLFSPFNYFLVADEDFIPQILMTGAEVHFLKSEAYLRGLGVAMNEAMASNEHLAGIQASVEYWAKTLSDSKLKNGGYFNDHISIPSDLDFSTLQNEVGFWNYTDYDGKLQSLYTQYWIDLYWQPAEAFSLVRRAYGKIPRENATTHPLEYFRLNIPQSEVQYNSENYSNAYPGNDNTNTKLWWMNW